MDDELTFRFDYGYTKPTSQIQLSNIKEIVRAIWLHYVYFLPHAELEQLRKGLRETLQLETLVCLHPETIHSFLAASSDFDVTSAYLLDCFSIDYSDQGSNKRTSEEAIILNWTDYVMECAGKVTAILSYWCSCYSYLTFSPLSLERQDVSLGDILHFFSGATKLPASGFQVMPKIYFTDENILPKASTCDVSITFPRSYGKLDYCEFKAKLDMCILDSFGFGNP